MYQYKAHITRVVDGDTVVADIDLGFYTSIMKQKLRLLNIDAPELKTEKGQEAKEYLKSLILDKEVIIDTKKSKDKYGRWLSEIFLNEESINDKIIESGFVK